MTGKKRWKQALCLACVDSMVFGLKTHVVCWSVEGSRALHVFDNFDWFWYADSNSFISTMNYSLRLSIKSSFLDGDYSWNHSSPRSKKPTRQRSSAPKIPCTPRPTISWRFNQHLWVFNFSDSLIAKPYIGISVRIMHTLDFWRIFLFGT